MRANRFNEQRTPRFRRRGGVYLIVLSSALIVLIIGVSALTAVRIQRQSHQGERDLYTAATYAHAAIQRGLLWIEDDPNWRSNRPHGVWGADQPVGNGTYTLEGLDGSGDTSLADDPLDALLLKGTGFKGDAQFKLQVTLLAEASPLEALRTAIHADSIVLEGGKSLTATGAPVSANTLLQLDSGATITGDAEAGSLNNNGTITGTVTVPAESKIMPDAGVFDQYANVATAIAVSSTIDRQVLTPTYNPWGATNPDGLYLINMAGGTLTITNTRIHGTLLVDNPTGTVVLDQAVFLQNARADYPALVVRGNVELLYASDGTSLDEATLNTNFNPIGAPYLSVTDSTFDDTYPNEIHGLVHATASLRLYSSARVRGAILCEGALLVDAAYSDADPGEGSTTNEVNEVVYDGDLFASPPWGYTNPPVMKVARGSWRRIAN